AGDRDAIAVRIDSPLVAAGRLRVRIAFPYGSAGVNAANWIHEDGHTSIPHSTGDNTATIDRKLDNDSYQVELRWDSPADFKLWNTHVFALSPKDKTSSIAFVCGFSSHGSSAALPSVEQAQAD